MIYHIFYPLAQYFPIFNVTKYITFRAGCAFITAFIFSLIFWNFALKRLKKLKLLENIDMYGHKDLTNLHAGKRGTPTMGGILIIAAVIFSTLLWARLDNIYIWLSLFVMASLGFVGFLDDFFKTTKGKGLSRMRKLFYQIVIGVFLGIFFVMSKKTSTALDVPFFKNIIIDLGPFYVFWAAFIIIATSNAVNFTDGLDGLASGALIINFLLFAVLCYLTGHINFAKYLFIPHIEGTGELTVLCLALVGAVLVFLFFNAYPADIFMGDVGALALGGVVGVIALFVKKEFLLILSGGLFVVEALSVIIQLLSVKYRKKKVFLAAPIHHHFQILGWKEPKIIVRLWIFSAICAMLALMTLKLR